MTGEGKLEVENPAEALRNQDGIFKVISPYGHIFRSPVGEDPICESVKSATQKIRNFPKSPTMTDSMNQVSIPPCGNGKSRRLPE
jgi:hypothetical protein